MLPYKGLFILLAIFRYKFVTVLIMTSECHFHWPLKWESKLNHGVRVPTVDHGFSYKDQATFSTTLYGVYQKVIVQGNISKHTWSAGAPAFTRPHLHISSAGLKSAVRKMYHVNNRLWQGGVSVGQFCKTPVEFVDFEYGCNTDLKINERTVACQTESSSYKMSTFSHRLSVKSLTKA